MTDAQLTISDPTQIILHASCVALGDQCVLITGASGAGKSSLALELLALGMVLVADDKVILNASDPQLHASAPDRLRGMIEARHVGLLNAQTQGRAAVSLVVDLDKNEPDRLPPKRKVTYLGLERPLIYGRGQAHLSYAILQWLKSGRRY